MRFSDDRPIFEQIASLLESRAASGELAEGDRLPSARELAASLEVNPNTAARALQTLADRGIARSERGSGYFVCAGAVEKALAERRRRFFDEELPRLFASMRELNIDPETITERWVAQRTSQGEHP
jgi:DNA-binding transcriptional regulator YhcF (GntR family)